MMLQGEYESLCAIEKAVPGFVPGMIDFGQFKDNPDGHKVYFLVKEQPTRKNSRPSLHNSISLENRQMANSVSM